MDADIETATVFLRAQSATGERSRLLRIAVALLEQPDALQTWGMKYGTTRGDLKAAMDYAAWRYGSHPALAILHVHSTHHGSRDVRLAARMAREIIWASPAFRSSKV